MEKERKRKRATDRKFVFSKPNSTQVGPTAKEFQFGPFIGEGRFEFQFPFFRRVRGSKNTVEITFHCFLSIVTNERTNARFN